MLFKQVELKEGTLVQFLAAYVLKWKNGICTKPEIGFVEATKKDLEDALKNKDYLEEI